MLVLLEDLSDGNSITKRRAFLGMLMGSINDTVFKNKLN